MDGESEVIVAFDENVLKCNGNQFDPVFRYCPRYITHRQRYGNKRSPELFKEVELVSVGIHEITKSHRLGGGGFREE